ncbi:transposable element Tc1 transposase [Trichonephila clavipes]|uniref:Transposable element Tc1 transposase n=1 Tax=Trichonephila clavipes TaxID=2585209 RepID=A0A8X6RN38_TRICX|nr:transposable element Tc1 transposase [Trichonephila clavipes]
MLISGNQLELKRMQFTAEVDGTKRNRRVTSTRVTPMVTASISKAISAATVRRRLHMNGLYASVPRVCVPLSVQSRGARLKWCREHGNWTVSD